jgi:hypothetical protein
MRSKEEVIQFAKGLHKDATAVEKQLNSIPKPPQDFTALMDPNVQKNLQRIAELHGQFTMLKGAYLATTFILDERLKFEEHFK